MNISFNAKYLAKNFIWLDSVKSTNSYVKNIQDTLKDNTIVATLNQTAGRGTKNKKFHSVAFKTLAISFFLKQIPLNLLVHFNKACAVSLILTLKKFNILNCKIKWFNDILINNKKIAGILCESSILNKHSNLIVGAGINVLTSREELNKFGLENAGSIFSETKKIIPPLVFLKTFVEIFDYVCIKFIVKKENDINNFSLQNKNSNSLLILNDFFEKYCKIKNSYFKVLNIKTKDIFIAKAIKILFNGKLLIKTKTKTFAIDSSLFSIVFP